MSPGVVFFAFDCRLRAGSQNVVAYCKNVTVCHVFQYVRDIVLSLSVVVTISCNCSVTVFSPDLVCGGVENADGCAESPMRMRDCC